MASDPTTITKAVQVSVNGVTKDLPLTRPGPLIHPVNAPARVTRTGASPCRARQLPRDQS
jgi:hypothetical protein